MIETAGYDATEIVEFTKTFFPVITLDTFPHVFKLKADTVAAFLDTDNSVTIINYD